MPPYDASALGRVAPISECILHKADDAEIQADDYEDGWEIEQAEKPDLDMTETEFLDLGCLEQACAGVLCTLWCELTTYARQFGVPKSELRAMVQCAFLDELDKACFWLEVEEDARPLTREKYLKVLEQVRRIEEVRVHNAKFPDKVPKEIWRELQAKARAGRAELAQCPQEEPK